VSDLAKLWIAAPRCTPGSEFRLVAGNSDLHICRRANQPGWLWFDVDKCRFTGEELSLEATMQKAEAYLFSKLSAHERIVLFARAQQP
jgi:hypothetical protein